MKIKRGSMIIRPLAQGRAEAGGMGLIKILLMSSMIISSRISPELIIRLTHRGLQRKEKERTS
jgi:hypothetical protein